MRFFLLAPCWLCIAASGWADVQLPKIIGSQMVLQRDSDVKLWGWAAAGELVEVSCSWLDQSQRISVPDSGRWEVVVPTGGAGGPHSIKLAATNTIELDDILFGEVWLASGQSNMEMPLVRVSEAYTAVLHSEHEVSAANFPEIRLFQVGNFSSKEPLVDVEPGISMYGIPPADCRWKVCSPANIPHFASTAYFFARHLHRELKLPIGIIDASWGGTPAEAWTPIEGLRELGMPAEINAAETAPQDPSQKVASRLFNGMIHPLREFRIKGAIWYQGEGNASRAGSYRQLFTTMIRQWREAFGYEFPFYFVQIAPFNYGQINSAYLREAQLETLSLANTAMAVTMDIGNLTDIHPKNKQQVGRRLALPALAQLYGFPIEYSGPVYRAADFDDGRAVVKFDHAQGGLATNDGQPPSHFMVAGADQKFYPARASIDGTSVVVVADQVAHPQAVRYAFTNDAQPNLTNQAGLPAASFRTDRW